MTTMIRINYFIQFTITVFAILLLSGCDQDKVLSASDFPDEISSYVTQHFPNHDITQVIKDKDGLNRSYEVILSENVYLEFDRSRDITEIEGESRLPDSVIPEKIRTYVASNYPEQVITKWELDDRRQKIELDNELELEFTRNGDFKRLDD